MSALFSCHSFGALMDLKKLALIGFVFTKCPIVFIFIIHL